MLDDSRLEELVSDQTEIDLASTEQPILATNRDGTRQAIVPAGQKWIIAAIHIINTSGSVADAYVWFVPGARAIASTNTSYLRVRIENLTAQTTQILEPSASCRGVSVLYPDDAIWIMGGGVAINVVILGYKVPL